MTKVSDSISKEEVLGWTNEEVIFIKAGTGVGKSYFIKNTLYEVAKAEGAKILFLIHRTNCINQFKAEVERDNKMDVIDIKTYQEIEYYIGGNGIKSTYIFNIQKYKYVVCDESHYFFSDSKFNKFCDISLGIILHFKCIKILMSATGDKTEEYVGGEDFLHMPFRKYELPIKFNFIDTVVTYKKDEDLIDALRYEAKQNPKDKYIIFCDSAKKCYEYYTNLQKHSMFLCSQRNELYSKVDGSKVDAMLKNEKFECNFLFTTTCLDAGVNIVDSKVKGVIIDGITDIDVLIQCIGRKRFTNKNQKITLILRDIKKVTINNKIRNAKKVIQIGDDFRNMNSINFVNKYGRDFNNSKNAIVYSKIVDGKEQYVLNELSYYGYTTYIAELEEMEKVGYINYIFSCLGLNRKKVKCEKVVDAMERSEDMIEIFINKYNGQPLDKDLQKQLIDLCNLKDNRGRLQKKISTINGYLEDNYKAGVVSVRATIDKKRTRVWMIIDK
jgi:hypothetical protein